MEKEPVASWMERLDAAKAEIAAPVDPWRLRLEHVRGKVGDDGIERISTQTLFDHLEVLQRSRGAGACRRLAHVMRDLGWTPVRVRDLTRGGYKEQVRGYARDPRSGALFDHAPSRSRPRQCSGLMLPAIRARR
jgi:hypothetical protein